MWLFASWLVLASLSDLHQATPQEPTKTGQAPNPLETLRNRVSQSELVEEEKLRILEVVAQAESQTSEAVTKNSMAEANRRALETVSARLESAKSELDALKQFQPQPAPPGQTLGELEARLAAIESDLNNVKRQLAEADASIGQMTKRRSEVASELPSLEKQLIDRKALVDSAKAAPAASLAAEAALAELVVSETLLRATIDAMQSELALIDAEAAAGIRQANRDVLVGRVESLQQQLLRTKQEVEAARAKDAANRVETAEAQLKQLHPALMPIGEQNRELAKQNQELATQIEEIQGQLTRRQERLEELKNAFDQAKGAS